MGVTNTQPACDGVSRHWVSVYGRGCL